MTFLFCTLRTRGDSGQFLCPHTFNFTQSSFEVSHSISSYSHKQICN